MTGPFPYMWPNRAAVRQRAGRRMDVTLHLGTHRTGSTTFQSYMARHSNTFQTRGRSFWGPKRTRGGLFAGLQPNMKLSSGRRKLQKRAQGRVHMHLDLAAKAGITNLLISDENMIGSVRSNLRKRSLYPAIGERLARIAPALEGHSIRVMLNIRAQDLFWASSAACGVARGHPMLQGLAFDEITENTRTWRDVIQDLSCALPDAEIVVLPFERFAGRPDAMLRCGADWDAPMDAENEWLNRAPNTAKLQEILQDRGTAAPELQGVPRRWQPFGPEQVAALRENYADDMFWLTAGADGLATLTEDTDQTRVGITPPFGLYNKGQGHELQERHLAQPG